MLRKILMGMIGSGFLYGAISADDATPTPHKLLYPEFAPYIAKMEHMLDRDPLALAYRQFEVFGGLCGLEHDGFIAYWGNAMYMLPYRHFKAVQATAPVFFASLSNKNLDEVLRILGYEWVVESDLKHRSQVAADLKKFALEEHGVDFDVTFCPDLAERFERLKSWAKKSESEIIKALHSQ